MSLSHKDLELFKSKKTYNFLFRFLVAMINVAF